MDLGASVTNGIPQGPELQEWNKILNNIRGTLLWESLTLLPGMQSAYSEAHLRGKKEGRYVPCQRNNGK